MVSFPFCKINLGLGVVGKRPDGYHNIETCFYPIPWCDILEVIESKSLSFTNTGIVVPGGETKNLCIRAYSILEENFKLPPVAIHLHKIIPMGAGLGGGSSDAAHVLTSLNELFDLKLPFEELAAVANQLGSDCSFFLQKNAMMGSGRGELLTPGKISLSGKFAVIVKPDIHISTVEAYQQIKPKLLKLPIEEVLKKDISVWRSYLVNDFEESVSNTYPQIELIKEKLYAVGATYSAMSGSGSAVFGIFDSSIDLKGEFKAMTYWSGGL